MVPLKPLDFPHLIQYPLIVFSYEAEKEDDFQLVHFKLGPIFLFDAPLIQDKVHK